MHSLIMYLHMLCSYTVRISVSFLSVLARTVLAGADMANHSIQPATVDVLCSVVNGSSSYKKLTVTLPYAWFYCTEDYGSGCKCG